MPSPLGLRYALPHRGRVPRPLEREQKMAKLVRFAAVGAATFLSVSAFEVQAQQSAPQSSAAGPQVGSGSASSLLSNGVLQERNVSLALAQDIARGVVEACAGRNFNVSATVVDRAGVVRAMLRADRAGPHTLKASRAKAFTSASIRNATSAVLAAVEQNPAQRNLGQIQGFLLLGGGVPIKAGEEVIGAVGVGGAPSGQIDEECANAGLDRVRDRLR